ncbi:phospho-sugar mutase [Fulvivirga sp. M361]|uniref:phospho-sugar mutase n=1 Tax=Fulvivirga sp. M361 TaxID=2594266 RepID=UPI00117A037E|nr:phospho-sugar mutase [Fulvivirga sp. M361]TRX48406.1 phospho-sugar mutase [Fulvivirga sp. M361]
MNQEILTKAESWLNSNIDEPSKEEIRSLMSNEESLTDAFYKELEFGTGGLRGIMGIGSNRMNKYTVGMATQGLANYLLKCFPDEQVTVAIAYDSRNNSRFFAETTAAVFSSNAIKVYLFDDLRPTPELSFTIRHLGCKSGVVLTASHNPKEYNGYKAYWDDGAQLVPPHDKNVIEEVKKIESISQVKFDANHDLIESIGESVDNAYLEEIKKLALSPDAVSAQKDLKIVFSPIHGSGGKLVAPSLKEYGFTNVTVVEEQAQPDGNFPTVVYPNPEEKEALTMALKKAEEINADLVMATDPDADRVGIAVKNSEGQFQLLNGNQTGSLLIYYVLERWKERNQFQGNEFVVKTIVTTELIQKIADHYEVDCYSTLTGFKYIASLIKALEGQKKYIAGGEESYGYMISDFVRDKDAVSSCAMIAEMCAYAKTKGISLYEMMLDMYVKFGFYKETLISITKKGKQGAEEIVAMMSGFRSDPPKSFAGSPLVKVIDYQSGISKDVISGAEEQLDYDKSNVLQFFTEDGYKISARPSGTEPKIKFYISVNKPLSDTEQYKEVDQNLNQIIDNIKTDLQLG